MPFRDDHDALRSRAEGLEAELGEARRELASARSRAEHTEELKAELATLRTKLELLEASVETNRGPHRSASVVSKTLAVVLAAAGCVAALVASQRAREERLSEYTADVPRRIEKQAEAVAPIGDDPSPAAAPPSEPVRTIEATWTGKVRRSTGSGLRTGAQCTLTATLSATSETAPHVVVACGGKEIYSSHALLNGISSNSWNVADSPVGSSGSYRYRFKFDDIGARTGPRTQASINTFERAASVWGDSTPAFRVDMTFEADSAPVSGKPVRRIADPASVFDHR
jgi:hypothetical protein